MNVTKIGTRIIPAVLAINAMTAVNVSANNQLNDSLMKENEKVEILKEESPYKNKYSINWFDMIVGCGLGIVGGVVGASTVGAISKNKNQVKPKTENEINYFDEEFIEDADKMHEYMTDILTETIANGYQYLNEDLLNKRLSPFVNKYPSRSKSVEMFVKALQDSRLDDMEREHFCQYLILKTTFASNDEKELIDIAYTHFEQMDDYEKMINIITSDPEPETPVQDDNKTNNKENKTKGISFNNVQHNLKFKDVGGQNEAIKILKKNILFPILYPNAFKNNSINHGFLLYGPPGTGKTLVSEALANEAKAHFIKLNGNELSSKWVGETEENWRKLFKEAEQNQPTIICIDEFDGIAAQRGKGDVYNDKVVNQILGLISDIEKNNSQIYIIATTNRMDMIDSAILRSGRIGKHVELKAPGTKEDVKEILNIHINRYPHSKNLNLDKISEILLKENVTGADIAFITNEAYETSMERNSIYEKMDNNTFNTSNMDEVMIIPTDIEKAINIFREKHKKAGTVGFKKYN